MNREEEIEIAESIAHTENDIREMILRIPDQYRGEIERLHRRPQNEQTVERIVSLHRSFKEQIRPLIRALVELDQIYIGPRYFVVNVESGGGKPGSKKPA